MVSTLSTCQRNPGALQQTRNYRGGITVVLGGEGEPEAEYDRRAFVSFNINFAAKRCTCREGSAEGTSGRAHAHARGEVSTRTVLAVHPI